MNISEAVGPFGEVFMKYVFSGLVGVPGVWIVAVLVKPVEREDERVDVFGRERAWRIGSGTDDIV
jgi:hypothetical protein